MPELPEVETVVQTLKLQLINRSITDCQVFWDNIIEKPQTNEFINQIKNQTINDITRIGKLIIFHLDDDVLISHLRMEGKYYIDQTYTHDKHSHVIMTLSDGRFLRYHDTRKFGKMYLLDKNDYLNQKPINILGLEPFHINCTHQYLYDKISNKRIAIKTCLLDQTILVGLGNIYVDEVLFRAKIHPQTPCNFISEQQCQTIIDESITVLNKAISLGGTTIRSYTSSLGVSGRFQNELLVHTRVGLPCYVCSTTIIKIKVNGRGTYLCPHCQEKLLLE